MNRSPDGQTLMLSSADGYCSIVVFDMSELGTVHATQQHNRQLAAIAQSHSHSHSYTPVPHSPAISTTRQQQQSPALSRTDREGSTASSVTNTNYPSQSTSIPLFCPPGVGRASSTTSSVEVLPTPGEESDGFAFPRVASGSESGQSVSASGGGGAGGGVKRAESDIESTGTGTGTGTGGTGEVPKKKRRVMLSKVADE
jgi:chromatin assembly factor 1 subunit B